MKENNENKRLKPWRKTKRIILLKIQLLKMEKILLVMKMLKSWKAVLSMKILKDHLKVLLVESSAAMVNDLFQINLKRLV